LSFAVTATVSVKYCAALHSDYVITMLCIRTRKLL